MVKRLFARQKGAVHLLGSGSHKNESLLPVIAMEKEAHVHLIHHERCGEGERFAHKASPKRWRKVAYQRST